MRPLLSAAVLFVVWGLVGAARAETCPDVPDDEVALRRSMAKEWFAKAEESEAAGDRQAAVRRYACSLNLAPHPSTAYNLGTVAEKSGDLSMALDGFRTYLKLATEATDRPAIEARIVALEAKISELRKIAPKPNPAGLAAAATAPPASQPAPTPPVVSRPAPPPADDGAQTRKVVAWVSVSGAAATLASGVVFNLLARGKMDECHRKFDPRMPNVDLCNEAKPLAYTSYALFGATAALGVTGAMLFLSLPGNAASEEEGTSVALVPTGDGATLLARGHF